MTATTPPDRKTPQGNAIVSNPLPWHTWIVAAFVTGIGIWLVEQYVDDSAAIVLTGIILLGIMYKTPGFWPEATSMLTGSFK